MNIPSQFLNRSFQINCLATIIIIVLTFIFQYPYLFDYPSQIHAWAQTDRYALVLGFLNNDLNLFLPETFVYNHQFPASPGIVSEKTITAVDFPIHEYLVALIMKLVGTTDVWIFRCYNIVYSMIGLLFLFKLSQRLIQSNIYAFLVLIFVMTSPVYAYYQGALLPTITSLSNVFIGLYFYIEYLFTQRSRNLNLSIFFITLAALCRSTFVIVFIAIAGLAFLKIFYQKGYLKKIWLPFVLATAFLVFNILYNSYLRKTYGSIFLSQLLPASDWTHAKILLQNTWNNWKYDYFSSIHYWFFIILLIFAATVVLLHQFRKNRITKNPSGFIHFVLVLFVGVIAFSVAMMQQFVYHDYYFLDSLFVPLVLLFIFLLSNLRHIKFRYEKHISMLILCVFSVPAISQAINSQKKRKDKVYWETTSLKIRNYQSAAKLLAEAKVPIDGKILVLDSGPPNLSFVFLNRKGFALMDTHRENIIESLNWPYDYILIERDFFASDIYAFYPEIIDQLVKVAENDFVILCTLDRQNLKTQNLENFLLEGFQNVSYNYREDFDSTLNLSLWEGLQLGSFEKNSPNQMAIISPESKNLTIFRLHQSGLLKNNSGLVYISFDIYSSMFEAFHCSITWEDKGEMLFYREFNISGMYKNKKNRKTIYLLCILPKSKTNEKLFSVYLKNLGSENYYLDNFFLRFIDL